MNTLPNIPEYYKRFVDENVDLEVTHSIPCPFHNEEHGKSFSYSPQKGIFRCWGACHKGGDVIALHQLRGKFKTREDAKADLYRLYAIDTVYDFSFKPVQVNVNEKAIHEKTVYAAACRAAKTVEDYIELDYIMSMVPVKIERLESFVAIRGGEMCERTSS